MNGRKWVAKLTSMPSLHSGPWVAYVESAASSSRHAGHLYPLATATVILYICPKSLICPLQLQIQLLLQVSLTSDRKNQRNFLG